ncbi:MAG TPA: hypothetical protein VFA33_02050 [Bryobacteraceae bacterium]|nr:hypothetical protein [Bryobacteraceae bacterium]
MALSYSTKLLALPFLFTGALAWAQPWDRNLLVNPGAESGPGAAKRTDTVSDVPGWTRTGAFSVGQYISAMPLWPSTYGPKDRGSNYFWGGASGGPSSATQTIDLSAGATEIDAGRVRFYLSGYLVSHTNYGIPRLRAAFLDAQDRQLLESEVSGPGVNEGSGLLVRASSGFVLPNTRKVVILLDLSASGMPSGTPNNSGADNLELVLRIEPIFGANLVVNGDFELPGNIGNSPTQPLGWNGHQSSRLMAYTADFIRNGLTPDDRGEQHLVFPSVESEKAPTSQRIDVTLGKDRIDAGGVSYSFSAWLGAEGNQPGGTSAKAEFFGSGNQLLGASQIIGPVTMEDRGKKAGMLKRSTDGAVPPETRSIVITLIFPRAVGFGAPQADNVTFTLKSAGAVAIKDNGIRNAASGAFGPIAPGEMVTILTSGVNLSDTTRMQLDAAGRVVTTLGEVRAFFDGTQAPLLYVNSSEIGAIVPFDVAGRSTVAVRVEYKGVQSQTVDMQVAGTAPGVFTLDGAPNGPGLISNDPYTINNKDNPAAENSTVTIYWTGGGQTDPPGVDGQIERFPLPRVIAPVSVTIGGKLADLRYAGAVPYGWAGLLIAEVVVPAGSASGDPVPVVITAGGASSPDNTVTMYVKQP